MTKEDWEMVLLSKSAQEIIEMIEEKFLDTKDGELTKILNSKKELNNIDENIKAIGIAKMEMAIETFKSNSHLSFVFTLFVAFITAYKELLSAITGKVFSLILVVIMIAGLIFSLIKNSKIDKKRMILAVYFKTLLEK